MQHIRARFDVCNIEFVNEMHIQADELTKHLEDRITFLDKDGEKR